MNNIKKSDKLILQSILILVISLAWITFLSALLGIFYGTFIWGFFALLTIFFYKQKIITFSKPSQNFLTYILISLSFALLIAFFTTPSIFSGRDQGSLSDAAILLSEHHNLISHSTQSDIFFNINEKGKALNFPGFFYTIDGGLITQFPIPYIAFISVFFGTFGTAGFVVANAILLFTFILAITGVTAFYMNRNYTLIFLITLLSSFSIGWFAKYTLSENIASALIWSSLFLYIFLKESKNQITYFALISMISLLLFTRIEGIWFFVIFSFLLLKNKNSKKFIGKDLWWRAIFPVTTLFVIFCTVLIVNNPFYITMIKAFLNSGTGSSGITLFDKISYNFYIYSIYGLILPLFFTLIASIISFKQKRMRLALLPIAIMFPLFLYYLFPQISGDHPWMLRRFVSALLPATILISILLSYYIKPKNIYYKIFKYAIPVVIILANIPSLILFLTYSENINLQSQIHDISQNFRENDLVLVDGTATGDGWSMMTSQLNNLENKNAVYFFNIADLDKLDLTAYEKVFLITPNTNKEFYSKINNRFSYVNKYTLTTQRLLTPDKKIFPHKFPKKENENIYGTIYEINLN
ncbi:MAG: hypothetical protein ACKUBY_04790 [Candidatus Moraniibacteriota bacterium]|jgi:hypothetical protein